MLEHISSYILTFRFLRQYKTLLFFKLYFNVQINFLQRLGLGLDNLIKLELLM